MVLGRTMALTIPAPEFKLLPIILPADIPSILRIKYSIFAADPVSSGITKDLTEEQFISSRGAQIEGRFGGQHAKRHRLAKIVLDDPDVPDAKKLVVSWVVWKTPEPAEEHKSEAEYDAELADMLAKLPPGKDTDVMAKLLADDRVMNKRLLGEGYEGKYWELESLATHTDYQRLGLGARLVQWGLEMVERDVRESESGVQGAYLIASSAGDKLYRSAGFEAVGERWNDFKAGKKERHVWFVKKFE